MTRKYTMRRRAEKQVETRQRILDAVVGLHEEVGPAQTTISAIAERAGVQRLTVYRHFPDEISLFEACRDHWVTSHPMPSPGSWHAIKSPQERLYTGLVDVYAYYGNGEQMIAHVLRDATINEAVAQAQQPMRTSFAGIHRALAEDWDVSPTRRHVVEAVISHALDFHTWQSLTRHHGLDGDRIAKLMVCLTSCAASDDCDP